MNRAKTVDCAKERKTNLICNNWVLAEESKHLSRQFLIDGIIVPREKEIFELMPRNLEAQKLLSEVPAGLVLTGGGAETVAMTDTARKVLSLSARVGRPQGVRGLIEEIETPMYATSMGLLSMDATKDRLAPVARGGFSVRKLTKHLKPEMRPNG